MTASRYQVRANSLKELGFRTYSDYLSSDIWRTIRERIFSRDKGKCKVCSRKCHSVHHVTYNVVVMRGDDDTQLISVCRGCHKHVEFDGDKKLVGSTTINHRLHKAAISRRGGSATKKLRKQSRLRCNCCGKKSKKLGRNDVCMPCYRSRRVLGMAKPTLQEAARIGSPA